MFEVTNASSKKTGVKSVFNNQEIEMIDRFCEQYDLTRASFMRYCVGVFIDKNPL